MVAEEIFVNCFKFNTICSVKEGTNFQGIFKTIWSQAWNGSRNWNLRLRGAGAERNIFGSATLLFRFVMLT